MDLDCEPIALGEATVAAIDRQILDLGLAIETGSGRRTKSGMLGMGGEEFQPWVIGAVM